MRHLIALLLTLAAGTQAITKHLVVVILDEGLRNAGPQFTESAPLLLDTMSLRRLRQLDPHMRLSGAYAGTPYEERIQVATSRQAILCASNGAACHVRDDGLFVRVDSVTRHGREATVAVTYVMTNRRPSGATAACTLPFQLKLHRTSGEWTLVQSRSRRKC
jgi:hypothetical protein